MWLPIQWDCLPQKAPREIRWLFQFFCVTFKGSKGHQPDLSGAEDQPNVGLNSRNRACYTSLSCPRISSCERTSEIWWTKRHSFYVLWTHCNLTLASVTAGELWWHIWLFSLFLNVELVSSQILTTPYL